MKRIITALLLLITSSAGAQLLKPLGKGIPLVTDPKLYVEPVVGMHSDNDNLSVLFVRACDSLGTTSIGDTVRMRYTLQINEWKNNQWDSVTTVLSYTRNHNTTVRKGSFRKNNGKYYFLFPAPQNWTYNDTIGGIPRGNYNIIVFTPSAGLTPLAPPTYNGEILECKSNSWSPSATLEFKSDTLYYLESLRDLSNRRRTCLFRYINNTWDTIPIPRPNADISTGEDHLLLRDGNDMLLANTSTYGIYRISGKNLIPVNLPRIADTCVVKFSWGNLKYLHMNYTSFYKSGDTILCRNDSNGISLWNGSNWQRTYNSNNTYLQSFVKHDGSFYAIGIDKLQWPNQYYQKLYKLEGLTWVEVAGPFSGNDLLGFLIRHQNRLFLGGRFDRNGCRGVAQLPDKLSHISGYVYHDENSDCKKDLTEKVYSNAVLQIDPGHYITNTNAQGRYSIFMDTGTYYIKLLSKKNHYQGCTAYDSVILDGTADLDSVDISQLPAPVRDLSVSINPWAGFAGRRGANEIYSIEVKNCGTIKQNGIMRFRYDKRLKNISSLGGPFNIIDDSTFSVAVDSIEPGKTSEVRFRIFVDPDKLVVGDKIRMSASILFNKDADSSDNYDTIVQRIVAACDPNTKDCYPSGKITGNLKKIKYHIHFQNTGEDTAIRVRVCDSFDSKLPIQNVILDACSHSYTVELRNNVITWTFENIRLTPDRVNLEQSQGFINFTANIDGNLAVGEQIRNKAYIYFDYEKAVITNMAEVNRGPDDTTVIKPPLPNPPKPNKFHVYPNPSTTWVDIELPEGSRSIRLYGFLGQELIYRDFGDSGVYRLDVSDLPAGIYTLRDDRGNYSRIIMK